MHSSVTCILRLTKFELHPIRSCFVEFCFAQTNSIRFSLFASYSTTPPWPSKRDSKMPPVKVARLGDPDARAEEASFCEGRITVRRHLRRCRRGGAVGLEPTKTTRPRWVHTSSPGLALNWALTRPPCLYYLEMATVDAALLRQLPSPVGPRFMGDCSFARG